MTKETNGNAGNTTRKVSVAYIASAIDVACTRPSEIIDAMAVVKAAAEYEQQNIARYRSLVMRRMPNNKWSADRNPKYRPAGRPYSPRRYATP